MTITPTPKTPKPPKTEATTDIPISSLFDPLLQEETTALMDAIRRRTIEEAELAGEMTRDAYLSAVRQLREAVEQNHFINPTQFEASIEEWQKETEYNWKLLVDDVTGLGDRVTKAAQAAWDILTEEHNNQPPQG